MDAHVKTDLFVHDALKEGVLVIRKIFDSKTISALTKEINKIREIVMAKVSTMDRPLKKYTDIAERELGRLDYRCGFTADIFHEAAEPIIQIIQRISPDIDFKHYWGAIPSLGGSGPTDMHRDVWPISNKTVGNNLSAFDLMLPPYYFTVLIPLVEITKKNGPTEFIKGSHYEQMVDDKKADIFSPLLLPGDIVIFDGRTLHRGTANKTSQERFIAYITFIANWYHDQTFAMNHYLFPELS